jgi:hypothetical protein
VTISRLLRISHPVFLSDKEAKGSEQISLSPVDLLFASKATATQQKGSAVPLLSWFFWNSLGHSSRIAKERG